MAPSLQRINVAVTGLVIVMVFGCYQEEENTAEVCVLPGDSPLTVVEAPDHDHDLVAGEALKISALFYFGVDIKARGLRCTAVRAQDRIIIETAYEWRGRSGSDARGAHAVACSIPALPAGTYVIEYGSQETILEIPSTSPAPCLYAGG